MTIRLLPWSLSLLALEAAWLVVLGIAWLGSRRGVASGSQRIGSAILVLPVLFMLGWEGGWWLIPADVAWLGVLLAERSGRVAARRRS